LWKSPCQSIAIPCDAIRFASSAVRESSTTSTRVGAGLPFAERHRAVLLPPASTQVTRAGSSTAAGREGLRADVGIPTGAGVSVLIKDPFQESGGRSETDDCGGDSTTSKATAQDSRPSSGHEPGLVDGRWGPSTYIVRIQGCRGPHPPPDPGKTSTPARVWGTTPDSPVYT
jgi:hypothetical protein